MLSIKKEFIRFLVWTRNGIAFCTTWFLILILVYNKIFDIQAVSTDSLIKLMLWIIGGVLIFNLIFTRLIVKKMSFTVRLTCFMSVIGGYECIGFYWFDFIESDGKAFEWTVFVGIILVLYFICMALYTIYSKRKGELYTQRLKEYQLKRSMENGK